MVRRPPELSTKNRLPRSERLSPEVAGETALTRTGSSIGTPLYMSPEQIGGASDERTDIWSLGVLFYEMLTGNRPFGGGNSATARYSILHRAPTPLAFTHPGLPDDLQPILDRALAKDVAQRYSTVAEMADDLAAVASVELTVTQPLLDADAAGAPPPAPGTSGAPSARPLHRRWRLWTAAAITLALSAGALAWASMARRPAAPLSPVAAASAVSARAVAVLPFTFRGRDEFAYLSEGMVDLLATKLDGAGDLRSVDLRALLSHLQSSPDGAAGKPLDPARAARIGQRFGADLVLLGNAVEVAGQLHLDARLYRAATAAEVASGAAEGAAAEIFTLIDRLAAQLLAARQHGPATRPSPSPGMAEHDRQLVEAHAAYSCGDGERAERLFRDILHRHPDDLEAWAGLAETKFHYGPLFGRSRRRSSASWQRVLKLEPGDFSAHLHLARLELYDRDFDALAARADHLETLLAGTPGMDEVRFYRASLPQGATAREALRRSARTASLTLDWMPPAFFAGSK